jgi:hypothetical protein
MLSFEVGTLGFLGLCKSTFNAVVKSLEPMSVVGFQKTELQPAEARERIAAAQRKRWRKVCIRSA